jgi:periplasmic copper chaperone A
MKRLNLLLLIIIPSIVLATNNEVYVKQSWVRETIPGVKNSSAYFTIYNPSDKTLILLSAKSQLVETVELHSHSSENGVMKMRKLDSVLIPSKGFVEFKLMSNHLMLFGLKKKIKAGDIVPFTLKFKNHSPLTFTAIVKRPK